MKKLIIISGCILFSCLGTAQALIQFGEAEKLSDKINTESEEIMPMISNDNKTLYFVRTRYEDNVGGAKTGHDIWRAKFEDDDFTVASNDIGKLNNEGNNAVVGIAQNNSKLYLLNAYKAETKEDIGVAMSEWDGKWTSPKMVEINNIEYKSDFYGFYIDPTETVMFISMLGPESNGLEDLYVSTRSGDAWTTPQHLEGNINSKGYEISPYLSQDGKRLYFSSDGHGGEGSADVFYVERLGDGWTNWGDPVNLGSNINSSGFDAYFIEAPDSMAYFASNRENGYSDIYKLKITWEEEEEEIVEVIEEVDSTEGPVEVIPENLPIPHFGNIYFDIDEYFIRNEAKPELEELVAVLKDRPEIKISIEGHADKTWTEAHNQVLSENRAKEVKKYLIKNGVSKDRIKTIGYGENKPDVKCDECTDEQLQMNRRVEFKLFEEKPL